MHIAHGKLLSIYFMLIMCQFTTPQQNQLFIKNIRDSGIFKNFDCADFQHFKKYINKNQYVDFQHLC